LAIAGWDCITYTILASNEIGAASGETESSWRIARLLICRWWSVSADGVRTSRDGTAGRAQGSGGCRREDGRRRRPPAGPALRM
jgi:hypothetical protein